MTDDRRRIEDRRDLPREQPGRRASDRLRQPKVDCPYCQGYDSLVVDGWPDRDAERRQCYVRRRECQNPACRMLFHTEEKIRDRTISRPSVTPSSPTL